MYKKRNSDIMSEITNLENMSKDMQQIRSKEGLESYMRQK